MKRLTSLPTTRYIFPSSAPSTEPQPTADNWIVEHIEQPRPEADLMAGAARIIGAIAVALVVATILCQLTKRPESLPVVSERSYQAPLEHVQWGAR